MQPNSSLKFIYYVETKFLHAVCFNVCKDNSVHILKHWNPNPNLKDMLSSLSMIQMNI